MLIYKITHKIYGTSYIGQTTKTLKSRWTSHVSAALKGKRTFKLHHAIRKYGPEAFEIEEVCTCLNIEELNQTEILCIDIFNTVVPSGYNMTLGGEGTRGHRGGPRGKGSRKPLSLETRNKIGNAHRGRTLPLEQRQKMSNSRKGMIRGPFSEEHKRKISEGNKGKKLSEETKTKMSIAHKQRCARQKAERESNERE